MIVEKEFDDIFVAPGAKILGDVSLGEGSSVWYNATIRADSGEIVIGKNSNIQDNCVVHMDPGDTVRIGDNVTVGHGAIVHGCQIDDNVIIGMGAIVLNGAHIESNCVIGAGALITQRTVIPAGSLVIGSPAKVKRALTDEELQGIIENAEHYRELSQSYLR